MLLNIFTLSIIIAGIVMLSLNNQSNVTLIFGSIMIILGLIIMIISLLVYIFAKDPEDISIENPIPVGRVVNNEDLQVDNIKIVVGIAV